MKKFYITLLLMYAILFVEVYILMSVVGMTLFNIIRLNIILSILCVPALPFMIEQLYND